MNVDHDHDLVYIIAEKFEPMIGNIVLRQGWDRNFTHEIPSALAEDVCRNAFGTCHPDFFDVFLQPVVETSCFLASYHENTFT